MLTSALLNNSWGWSENNNVTETIPNRQFEAATLLWREFTSTGMSCAMPISLCVWEHSHAHLIY